MSRAKNGKITRNRHNKALKRTKGFYGRASRCYRVAIERGEKAMQYAYRDRRTKKRQFRRLWTQRINAAARINGITYSRLINGLKLANIEIDRKVLSDLAITQPAAFAKIAESAKKALEATAKKAA